jgi:probable DNA repair protein
MPIDLASLDDDTLLLTVNKRLAADLRRRHAPLMQDSGLTVWPTPSILPFQAWLSSRYTTLVDQGDCRLDLLSRAQEHLLWERVVRRHTPVPVLRPAAAAQLAAEAHGLVREWSIDLEQVVPTAPPDTIVFAEWYAVFRQAVDDGGLLSQADLATVIADAVTAGRLGLPARIGLAGFGSLSPARRRVIDALAAQGVEVDRVALPVQQAACRRLVARDDEHEAGCAAAWAAATLAQRPWSRLAIVVPALGARRRQLARIFAQTLAPATYLGDDDTPLPFNLSLGAPLDDYPLVAAALAALRLAFGSLTLDEAGALLRSPFLGGHADEGERRALLDVRLRRDGRPRLGIPRLVGRMERLGLHRPESCPNLLARLREVEARRPAARERRRPAAWAAHLRDILVVLGWPGDQPSDSAEHQQYQRFLDLLDELAGLGKVAGRIDLGRALTQLERLARETLFQPQTPPCAVQIVGPLEAVGQPFDGIWLLGLDDRHWPAPAQPNPLLPAPLQRRLGLPNASAEHEQVFAADLMARFAEATPVLIASHAAQHDEQPLRPSPLIGDWPTVQPDELQAQPARWLHEACRAAGERSERPAGCSIPGPAEARGGAALLGTQASCPFAALVRYRLDTEALPEPLHAPDAGIKGGLVHRLLQAAWTELGDSQTLASRTDDDLRNLLAGLADGVLDEAAGRHPHLYPARFRALESERLVDLGLEWLRHERGRETPFRVHAVERRQTALVNGLSLALRADRIDRLDDGSLAVIDYKTGRDVTLQAWFDERIGEVQLPLYALNADGPVAAVALARVRRDGPGCRFVGLARDPGFADGVQTPGAIDADIDWPGLLARWRRGIDGLAAEFLAGRADPTPSPNACRHCDLGPLCRVSAHGGSDGPDDG